MGDSWNRLLSIPSAVSRHLIVMEMPRLSVMGWDGSAARVSPRPSLPSYDAPAPSNLSAGSWREEGASSMDHGKEQAKIQSLGSEWMFYFLRFAHHLFPFLQNTFLQNSCINPLIQTGPYWVLHSSMLQPMSDLCASINGILWWVKVKLEPCSPPKERGTRELVWWGSGQRRTLVERDIAWIHEDKITDPFLRKTDIRHPS